MPRDRDLLFGSFLALVAASCFGTLGPLSRFASEAGLGAVAFVAWRAGIGGLLLASGVIARGSGLGSIARLDRRGRLSLALAATTGFLLNLAVFVAFSRTTIAVVLVLFYTYPAMVAASEVALGRERLTAARLAALVLASLGVVLVLLGGLDPATGLTVDPLGAALALSAAACQTVFVTVSRHGFSRVPSDVAMLVVLAVSVAGSVTVALVAGLGAQLIVPLGSLAPWPVVLVAGVLGAGFPSLLFLSAIRRIGGVRTGILMLSEPVVGALLAASLLGEPLRPVQVLGGALVLAGAIAVQLAGEPAAVASPTSPVPAA